MLLSGVAILVLAGFLLHFEPLQMRMTTEESSISPPVDSRAAIPEKDLPQRVRPQDAENKGVLCTQEAKQCPDGSYVGRTGPHCEFATCPGNTEPGAPTSDEEEKDAETMPRPM